MTNELKPCPFCGGRVAIKEFTVEYNNGVICDYSATIECICGLSFYREWTTHKAKDGYIKLAADIIDAWNMRAEI